MIKKILKFMIVLITITYSINVNASNPMAHNIYSDPIITNGQGVYDTYMIDFNGVVTPNQTYWALCNWGMDLGDFKKNHLDVEGGGAYAGLQVAGNKRKAIMSFWEVQYKDTPNQNSKNILRAKMLYPNKETNSFGGEGEGSNYITEFDWKTNNWYRMVIHSWINPETNRTYVGQWFLDLDTDEWTLISYFDTNLYDSGLIGNMSLFQENFDGSTENEHREFEFRNMYVRNKSDKQWISINKTKMSYDNSDFGYNTIGPHEFGTRNNLFYGYSGGKVDNQKLYDEKQPRYLDLEIEQNDKPDLREDKPEMTVTEEDGKVAVRWKYNQPQKSFVIKVTDLKTGEIIEEIEKNRPELRAMILNHNSMENKKYELFLTDIYDHYESKVYENKKTETINLEEEKNKKENNIKKISNNNQKEKKNNNNKINFIIFTIFFIFTIIALIIYWNYKTKNKK